MSDRASRRAGQQTKLSAMPVGRRVGLVVAGTLAAIAAAALVNLLLTENAGIGVAVLIGLVVGLVLSYQLLWMPARRS